MAHSLRFRGLGVAFWTAVLCAGGATAATRVIAWNDLGMHCMDADFSVFSILPPYNTIHAQVIDATGHLVTSGTGITVTYEAVADATGSVNRTSAGKTDFWAHVQALFGASPAVDTGLTGSMMPGTANLPRVMVFDAAHNWWTAEGIPITPYDDTSAKNPYPMMRVVAKNASGTVLASTDIVLPVSDEMDCSACHASGSGPEARPGTGWVDDPDPQRDYRLNILRLHDQHRLGSPTFTAALAARGYNATGLYATVVANGTPVLCAGCHASAALSAPGEAGVPALTAAVHAYHAHVTDPTNGATLDASDNRSACYRCHPGAETRCLRGAMGRAVSADGSLAIQCQDCHGSMTAVGGDRRGWLDEPDCQSCHTGTATSNNGQIRYTNAFEATGQPRQAVNQTFATNPNTPAAGLSLYRFSKGHGNLQCEACHGSTHAIAPSSHANDNVQAIALQGHEGTLAECGACHGSQPSTTSGGPHGMHPVGQSWVSGHESAGKTESQCQPCHGTDYRGTVLSRSFADRTLSAFGTKQFWRGFEIGCYTCHNGPNSDSSSSNRAPVASNASAQTAAGTAVQITLSASDADGNPLQYRIVGQPTHGRAGLAGHVATYVPDTGFVGTDHFTFAARDGSTDSNLATVTVTVSAPPCALTCSASAPTVAQVGVGASFHVDVTTSSCVQAVSYDWDFGDGTPHASIAAPGHVYTAAGSYTWTITASADGVDCTSSGTIVVQETAPTYRYLTFVSHNPGKLGTLWRSDLVAMNVSDQDAVLNFLFKPGDGDVTVTQGLSVNRTVEWPDAVASLFLVPTDAAGPVLVTSNTPVTLLSRIYTPYGDGTMGQSMPAITAADALERGVDGFVPALRNSAGFRSNLGLLNISEVEATVAIDLFDTFGAKLGQTVVVAVPANGWHQVNDVFGQATAGSAALAYAKIQVHTSGSRVWVYGSVVDGGTGDPTTVTLVHR